MPSNHARPLTAAAAAAVLALTLTACGGGTPTPGPSAAAPAGTPAATEVPTSATPTSASPSPTAKPLKQIKSLDGFKVTGAMGAKPKLSFTDGVAIDQTRSKVIVQGEGPTVQSAGYVEVQYLGINVRDSKEFNSSWRDNKGQPIAFDIEQVVPGFKKGLEGKKVGDRVLVVMPGTDAYDPQGGSPQAGINVGDSLAFVVDIVEAQRTGPGGAAITPKSGLPTVTETDGKPVIGVDQDATPPTKMVAQPLTAGDSDTKVAKGGSILAHYRSVSWKTGKQLEDVYAAPQTGEMSALIPCWQKGLVGKPVGSRVLLVCPPADGYPEGSNNPPLEKGDTIVYVVDILFASTQPLA